MNIPKKSIGHFTQYLHYPQFSTLIPGVNVFPLWCRRLTKSLWCFLLVSIYSIPWTFHWTSNSHGMVILYPFHPCLDVLWTFHHFCKLLRPNWCWWCNWCPKMMSVCYCRTWRDPFLLLSSYSIELQYYPTPFFHLAMIAHIWKLISISRDLLHGLRIDCFLLTTPALFQIQGHLSQQWLTPLWKWIHLG